MPTIFRLRHKQTGLYYCTSRAASIPVLKDGVPTGRKAYVRTNLSRTGKIYVGNQRNGFLKRTAVIYSHVDGPEGRESYTYYGPHKLLRVAPEDWEMDVLGETPEHPRDVMGE